MDFQLSPEQRALQHSIEAYLKGRFDLAAVRAVVDDPSADGLPPALWKGLATQGWLAVMVPPLYEGLGLDMVDAQVIARCFGAALIPGPWRSTVLAGEALRLGGDTDQQRAWLPRIALGDAVVSLSLSAGISQAGAALSGTVPSMEYAASADALVVQANGRLHLVDPAARGVTITPLDQYDGTTRLARVELSGATAAGLGDSSVARDVAQRAAVLAAADLVGVAREALTRTIGYVKTRTQFGQPIGSFQSIKHDLADLHVATTMAEHASLYAAYGLDAGLADAAIAVSVAKAKASLTAKAVTAAMIQYHGGIGFTWEHDAHLFYKRAKRLAATSGDAPAHLERLARLALTRPSTAANVSAESRQTSLEEAAALT